MNTNHTPCPSDPSEPGDDLNALLKEVHPDEAARLYDVWHLASNEEPVAFPEPAAAQEAVRRLHRAMNRPESRNEKGQHEKGQHEKGQHEKGQRAAAGTARRLDCTPYPPYRPVERRTLLARSGAVLMVVLVLGALGIFWWLRPVVRTASFGEHVTVRLPDGSTVELNSGATLRYRRSFGEVRAVELAGEAFFDVTQEARPFLVRTFNAEVRVLGTRFNVRAWPQSEAPATTVALESGRVALTPTAQPHRTVSLEPGQIRRIPSSLDAGDEPDSIAVSVAEATAWRHGDLIFKDEWLGTILDDIERRFAADLQIQPALRQQRGLNLVLRQPADAEAVLHVLGVSFGLGYRETSNGYELYARSP